MTEHEELKNTVANGIATYFKADDDSATQEEMADAHVLIANWSEKMLAIYAKAIEQNRRQRNAPNEGNNDQEDDGA